jgi:orotate phosphoribosyltransferase
MTCDHSRFDETRHRCSLCNRLHHVYWTGRKPKLEWVSNAKLMRDSARLAGMMPHDLSGVIGLPRSGMLPATEIATRLHVPLFMMTQSGPFLSDWETSRGSQPGNGVYAVVDDTVYSGTAMSRASDLLKKLGWPFLRVAVYVTPWGASSVDLYAQVLPPPHLLEWNVPNVCGASGVWELDDARNRVWGGGLAWDMDGVICEEAQAPDHDEAAYLRWLCSARPLLIPRKVMQGTEYNCPLIVTGRIERFREETLAWLKRYGVKCQRLVMHPASSMAERDKMADVAVMKGREFANSPCGIFLESERVQCEEIHRISKKPVICVTTGDVIQ